MINIVGFSGGYGVGKTTLVQNLLKEYPNDYYPLSFGDALREDLSLITGYTPNFFKLKPYPWIRDLLKGYGNMKRQNDKNYWVHRFNRKLKDLEPLLFGRTVLVDDVRFINEYDYIQNHHTESKVISLGDNVNKYNIPTIYQRSDKLGLILPKYPSLFQFFELSDNIANSITIVLTPSLFYKVNFEGLRTTSD